jgi:hypothetical protein
MIGFRWDEIIWFSWVPRNVVHDEVLRYRESIVGVVMGSVHRPQYSFLGFRNKVLTDLM